MTFSRDTDFTPERLTKFFAAHPEFLESIRAEYVDKPLTRKRYAEILQLWLEWKAKSGRS